LARYSILAVNPFLELRIKDGDIRLKWEMKQERRFGSPLETLRILLGTYRIGHTPGFPFPGGAIGMIAYDFVQYLERLPRTVTDDLSIPDLHLLFTDTVITVDHIERKAIASVLPGYRRALSGGSKDEEGPSEEERLEALCVRLAQEPRHSLSDSVSAYRIEHEMSADEYRRIVRQTKEYIAAGDIFQANLSQRIRAPIGAADPWEIYRVLRDINPSPFAGYLDMGDYQIASSSPERLVLVEDGVIQTRPIAGTRPRGRDADGDRRMRDELLLHPKERAEHIMLIDLERNDIGKVSEFGSVVVDELMVTENYSHVIHIVSNVRGQLLPHAGPVDVLRAVFPGGTITGVPKVRCMEIIDELEPVSRGPYTGSVGYIGCNGRMDLNIIIRTFVVKGGMAYVQAGAGIVADSDPDREYQETLKKAEALIRTLERL